MNRKISRPKTKDNQFILSAQADTQSNFLIDLLERIKNNQCHITQSSLQTLSSQTVIQCLVTGKWNALAKLETQLTSLKQQYPNCHYYVFRTFPNQHTNQDTSVDTDSTPKNSETKKNNIVQLRYIIQILGLSQPNVLFNITEFLNRQNIQLEEFSSRTFLNMDQIPMFSANLKIILSDLYQISNFKDAFVAFCDEQLLEVSFELLT